MTATQIGLLVGLFAGFLGTILTIIYILRVKQKNKHKAKSFDSDNHKKGSVYLFFYKWLIVFFLFTSIVVTLFCIFMLVSYI